MFLWRRKNYKVFMILLNMNVIKKKILIIEDQINIRKILYKRLKKDGYEILTTSNGREGLKVLNFFLPDLIILDIMLPGVNGYEICKQIRKKFTIPIIFLTALNSVGNKIKGLELGGNDYIVKPFFIDELEQRIAFILNKKIEKIEKINFGKIEIDFEKNKILKEKLIFDITFIEIKILTLLLSDKNRIFSRQEIINFVWGFNSFNHFDSRIVDTYILKLRSKIEDEPNNPTYLKTIRGVGYKLF